MTWTPRSSQTAACGDVWSKSEAHADPNDSAYARRLNLESSRKRPWRHSCEGLCASTIRLVTHACEPPTEGKRRCCRRCESRWQSLISGIILEVRRKRRCTVVSPTISDDRLRNSKSWVLLAVPEITPSPTMQYDLTLVPITRPRSERKRSRTIWPRIIVILDTDLYQFAGCRP